MASGWFSLSSISGRYSSTHAGGWRSDWYSHLLADPIVTPLCPLLSRTSFMRDRKARQVSPCLSIHSRNCVCSILSHTQKRAEYYSTGNLSIPRYIQLNGTTPTIRFNRTRLKLRNHPPPQLFLIRSATYHRQNDLVVKSYSAQYVWAWRVCPPEDLGAI